MTKHANQRTSVSALMARRGSTAQGSAFGHVREFAVAPTVDASHVYGMVVKLASSKRGDRPSLVPVAEPAVHRCRTDAAQRNSDPHDSLRRQTYLLLERDLLDSRSSTSTATKSSASMMSIWHGRGPKRAPN